MKLLWVTLFIFMLSKFNHVKASDFDKISEKYNGNILTSISERSPENSRIRSRRQSGVELSSCKSCGLANMKKKIRTSIIGGDDVVPPYKYPWMVKIESYKKNGRGYLTHFCAGAILNEYYILTAAHCLMKNRQTLEYFEPKLVNVTFVTTTYEVQQGPPVEQVIPHPEYIEVMKHDIALLKLKEKIVCDTFKRPICLPPSNFVLPKGAILTASGWGFTEAGRFSISEKLKESKVRMGDDCRLPRFMEQELHYCLLGINRQVTCDGDSGGPLFYKHGNNFYVVGVLSAGPPCSVRNPKSYYTSVPKHVNWIHETMRSSPAKSMGLNGGRDFGTKKEYGGEGDYGGAADY